MDRLDKLAMKFNSKAKFHEDSNVNFFGKSFKRLEIKNFNNLRIIIDEYENLFSVAVKINPRTAFSVNNPDRLFSYDKPVKISESDYKIYVSQSKDLRFLMEHWFLRFYHSLTNFFHKIKLEAGESVFIYENLIVFALNSDREFEFIMTDIASLIIENDEFFKTERREKASFDKVPEKLRSLLPLAKKYAISDDVDRNSLGKSIKGKKREELLEKVGSLMDEINEYLDSFQNGALSEEAILIGNLAELVSEIKVQSK